MTVSISTRFAFGRSYGLLVPTGKPVHCKKRFP